MLPYIAAPWILWAINNQHPVITFGENPLRTIYD
jgi:hypothetical protein